MTKEQFTERVLQAESTMFHVAFSILHHEADCADAVQEAVLKAYTSREKRGGHSVMLYGVRADAFRVELIVEKEEAQHASQIHALELSAVEYEDGTVVNEKIPFLKTNGTVNGNLVFGVSLQVGETIDTERIAALILDDGAERISLSTTVAATEAGKTMKGNAESVEEPLPWEGREETMSALYYSHSGYAVVTDGSKLYLWDLTCGKVESSLDLAQISYDAEKGEILVGAGGKNAFIFPEKDGDRMYIYKFGETGQDTERLIEDSADSLPENTREIFRSYRTSMSELKTSS